MRAGADEVQLIALDLLDQQKSAADVAFAVIGPVAFQRMVKSTAETSYDKRSARVAKFRVRRFPYFTRQCAPA
jgi:hypothetical protein